MRSTRVFVILTCGLILTWCAFRLFAQPQTFSSGSTGTDGALTFPAGAGLVYFKPSNYAARANNIYNFTTITIPAGTTVRLSSYFLSGPVYWLAQGDVLINGTLDLSGASGHPIGSPTYRALSEAGAGGYSGGLGRTTGAVTGQNATPGNGPGFGKAPGSITAQPDLGGGGSFTGGDYLVPLIGGSGGGGGCSSTNTGCGGGGAGGGAILIASSTQITLNGSVSVQGGGGAPDGGGGSGGAVRLVSNTIANSSGISCGGGGNGGGPGLVRIEAFSLGGNGVSNCNVLTSVPYNLVLPAGSASTLSVTKIGSTTINANPFTFPDTTINTGSSIAVTISGTFIPVNTKGTLLVFSESTPDQSFPFTLAGTFQSTTATVNVPFPPGGSRGFAKVTW